MLAVSWSHPAACEQMGGKITAAFQTADLALYRIVFYILSCNSLLPPHEEGGNTNHCARDSRVSALLKTSVSAHSKLMLMI